MSFFPEKNRKALAILGSRSGRDTDKAAESGLTPVAVENGVRFEQATLTFVCRKIDQHQLDKNEIVSDVQEYYAANPRSYPVDENGEWHLHWMFIGEITDVIEKTDDEAGNTDQEIV